MDWLRLSGGAPSLTLIPLGTYYNNQYHTSDQCLRCLEDLTRQLNCDDTSYTLRRGLGYVDILNKDLKSIMITSYRSWPKLFRSTVKLLVGITTPIECLAYGRTASQTAKSYFIYELKQLLYKAKEAFLDVCATRAIIDHVKLLLVKQPLSGDEIEFLNLSLLLIRNILDAPERPVKPGPQNLPNSDSFIYEFENCSQPNEIVFNLFAQGLDRLLLDMLACPQMDKWVVTIVEVIAAIYKHWSVESIQAQLSIVIESTKAVSFDKDEEDNMPWPPDVDLQPQNMKKKRRLKPYSRKLGRTLRKDLSNKLTISQPLARFTIDFMLNGYSIVLKELLHQLKQKDCRLPDKSHFLIINNC